MYQTSTGNIRRPPPGQINTLLGTPDENGPLRGPLGVFDPLANAEVVNSTAVTQELLDRIGTIVAGAGALTLGQAADTNLGPFSDN